VRELRSYRVIHIHFHLHNHFNIIMTVYYKFKSSKDYDTITFSGSHISVGDLKRGILQKQKLGKATDIDLNITNAQTGEGLLSSLRHHYNHHCYQQRPLSLLLLLLSSRLSVLAASVLVGCGWCLYETRCVGRFGSIHVMLLRNHDDEEASCDEGCSGQRLDKHSSILYPRASIVVADNMRLLGDERLLGHTTQGTESLTTTVTPRPSSPSTLLFYLRSLSLSLRACLLQMLTVLLIALVIFAIINHSGCCRTHMMVIVVLQRVYRCCGLDSKEYECHRQARAGHSRWLHTISRANVDTSHFRRWELRSSSSGTSNAAPEKIDSYRSF